MVFEGARENWEADLAKREATVSGTDPVGIDGAQALADWANDRAETVYDYTPIMRRRDARLGWGIVALIGSAIVALCVVAAMHAALGEELHKPVLRAWLPCPPDNPIAAGDHCTNAEWQKAVTEGRIAFAASPAFGAPPAANAAERATKADIEVLQAEINAIMDALSAAHPKPTP